MDNNNNNSKENILFKEIFLINKNKLQKYKETFEYEKLKSLLDEIIPSVPEIKKIRYKNISYEDFNNVVLDRIISELLKKNKYFIDKNKQNIPKNSKINNFDIKIINKNKKIIEYIDNFEIINNDISEYFINQKLIDKKEIIEGKLILQNHNICLVFNYNDKNFYEIGYLDENTNFIIEYIIKENIGKKNEFRDDIINILKVKGIKNLFDLRLHDGSQIWNEKKLLGHFYLVDENKIDTNEIKNEEDSISDDEFVKNIISFIILVHLFNNEIKEYINKKYVYKNKKNNFYLLNKTLLSQFKKIICYEEISTFFSKTIKAYGLYDSAIKKIKSENNGYFNNKILKNKANIIEFLKKNDYKDIKYEEIKINKNKFFFPTNFEVINEKAYVCLLNILGIDSYDNELEIIINPGKLFFKFYQTPDYNLGKIIFGFILNEQNGDDMNYELKNILIYDEIKERDNDFDRIVNKKNYKEPDNNSIIYGLNNQKIGMTYIVDKFAENEENNIIDKNNDEDIEEIDYTNAKKYIGYCIILYNEYSKIIDDYNNIDIPGEEMNNDYYLINQNYLRELESIIHFKDIKEKIEELNRKGKSYDLNDEMVEDLLKEFKNNKIIIEELNLIDDNKLKNLDNKQIYEIKKEIKKIKY